MLRFEWLAAGPIPTAWDLRRLGWRLCETSRAADAEELHPLLATPTGLAFAEWLSLTSAAPRRRGRILMLGVGDSAERARLLRLGFGDALPPSVTIEELELRALQRIERAGWLPRHRQLGPLRLDLLSRDGMVAGRLLALHPREFALLWRLGDQPGEAVAAEVLLRDVWRLEFRPETNSLAVHVSRLRTKLRLAGLDGLIETLPDGAYRLALAQGPALPLPAAQGNFALDAHLRLGKEQGEENTQREGAEPNHAP